MSACSVGESLDRDRVADPLPPSSGSREETSQVLLAGSFGWYLATGERGPDRPRAGAAADAHRLGGERCRRGAKIAALSVTERPPARRCSTRSVRRAVGPRRLQRPVRRPAEFPGMTTVVVACGALALHFEADRRAARLGPRGPAASPGADNWPERIRAGGRPGERRREARRGCGLWNPRALDELARLRWRACYDLHGEGLDGDEPGTYFLTDFLGPTSARRMPRPRPRPHLQSR